MPAAIMRFSTADLTILDKKNVKIMTMKPVIQYGIDMKRDCTRFVTWFPVASAAEFAALPLLPDVVANGCANAVWIFKM